MRCELYHKATKKESTVLWMLFILAVLNSLCCFSPVILCMWYLEYSFQFCLLVNLIYSQDPVYISPLWGSLCPLKKVIAFLRWLFSFN